ncbi:MAG: hypothetical protein WAV95_16025 [Azonexus sp.]
MPEISSRPKHLIACLAFPHVTGNMEGSRTSRLACPVFVVTARPDFLWLFFDGGGNPFFTLGKTADQGNGKARGVFEVVLKSELGKGVSSQAQSTQNFSWFPVFLTGFFCIACLHDFVTVVCYRCMIKTGLNMACQRLKHVDAFRVLSGKAFKRVSYLNQVLI